ncbi:heparan-sulfate 6-O-sulfotransferase 3-like [Budorcas taxicolor]|uniref:heparan-sulfate 6-O-sulfotransferase 3-like n=1 Tax=Budorcas taxicolor TaxID=37181 RepID=UPI0022838F80|nr:heparan-sulfate 6-O-sulfotransferase 3-like [Budorcas taxicolor]
MDERFNKWLLTPVLTLLFVVIMYQYVSPSCSSSCANFGEQPRAGEAGPPAAPSPARRAQAPPEDWERRPQLPPPPRGQPEGSRGAAAPEDEDEEPGDPEDEEAEAEEEEEEPDPEAPENGSLPRFVPRFNFTPKDLTRFVDFNIKGRDVIVFLHIQKTGGTTFGRHLVKNIRLEQPCSCKAGQKKCTCHRPGKKETWLFSRFSTGWSCGLHADWTELTNCVPAIMEKKDCPRNHSHTRYCPPAASSRFRPPSFPLQRTPPPPPQSRPAPSPGRPRGPSAARGGWFPSIVPRCGEREKRPLQSVLVLNSLLP